MFDRHWQDLGYGLLLKRYRADILDATPQEISQAAIDTVPDGAAAVLDASASWWASASS